MFEVVFVKIYNYDHSTKLYRKISRVCCRLYCYECAARVTLPTATGDIFSGIAWCYGNNDFIIRTIARSEAARVTCST